MSHVGNRLVRSRASIWISVLIWVVAATMMQPTLGSFLAILMIGGLLALLRWVSRIEGCAENNTPV